MVLKPFEHSGCPTFAQHLFNFCWMNVGQMLKQVKRALKKCKNDKTKQKKKKKKKPSEQQKT